MNRISNLGPLSDGARISSAVADIVSSLPPGLCLTQALPLVETISTTSFHHVAFCPTLPCSTDSRIPPWTIAFSCAVLASNYLFQRPASRLEPQCPLTPNIFHCQLWEVQLHIGLEHLYPPWKWTWSKMNTLFGSCVLERVAVLWGHPH